MALNLHGMRRGCLRISGDVLEQDFLAFWSMGIYVYGFMLQMPDFATVCVYVCVCAAYQSLHRALFGALNFSWHPRRAWKNQAVAAEETDWRDHCAFFPIRSQWSRKLKTFSLQSIKNNGRRQRNHSPSAKRRRMQYATHPPPPLSSSLSPSHPTVARIKLICMYVCICVRVCERVSGNFS